MMHSVSSDENGFLRGFPYHDGFLDGMITDDATKEVHLALRSSSGERRVLRLRHVEALHVDGFREGNIVSNLRMLPAARAAGDVQVRGMLAERLFLDAANLRPDTVVFWLESSFGAEVVAVCAEVAVSEAGATFALSP